VPLRAPPKNESSVTLTIPAPIGRERSSSASRSDQDRDVFGSEAGVQLRYPAVALRCVYTDLDGTLLGRGGSLFRDAEGNFSRAQARALEALHRADVEVVVKSGRREAQVLEDARLMGQGSYIYEAGCAVVVDGERTYLTEEMAPDGSTTVYEQIVAAGAPDLLFASFPGRLEYHSPWHVDRELSHLFRGKVEVEEANAILLDHGHDRLRLLDNGAIGRPMPGLEVTHAYHLVPRDVSKAKAVAFHMQARGYAREECIAVGDSFEDLQVADVVGRFFVPANGPARDPGIREAIAARDNVTVTEGAMGDGFYEAVVGTLAQD
jgi:HAD superfamily hydrolase (TIGR01484 family)